MKRDQRLLQRPPRSLCLDKHTCLVLDAAEPYGVWKAAQNVGEDIREVGGFAPRFRESLGSVKGLMIVVESTGRLARRFGISAQITKSETFAIRQVKIDGHPAILISGNGERGAIYGIYHFSETHLGTDPLKFWTEYLPLRRNPIRLKPVDYTSPPPTFRFRGFHIEGQQVIQRWQSADGRAGYGLYWEKVFETILRLKGNMVKPGTNLPDSHEVGLAQRMGLLVTQEHCCAFGIGMFFKPPTPDFNFSFQRHPKVFLQAWEDSLRRYPRPENVIWTIGHRGRDDRGFWFDDRTMPKNPTDRQVGKVITRVLREQVKLVKKHCGQHKPAFIHNLWMEGVRLYRRGNVKVPDEAHIVWADNGYGTFRSMIAAGCAPNQIVPSFPSKPTGGKHGSYVHVSMWDYNTPFYTQFVPPERLHQQYARMIKLEATAYLLANVGRLRPNLLGAAAVAEIGWNAGPWADPKSRVAEEFWNRWCRKYFGKLAAEARACYRALYETPFRWGEWGGWDDYVIGDVGYIRRARLVISELVNPNMRTFYENTRFKFWLYQKLPLPRQVAYLQGKTGSALDGWDRAHRKALSVANRLKGNARAFFESDVLGQIELHKYLNLYLDRVLETVSILLHLSVNEAARDAARARTECARARAHLDAAQAALRRMEQGKWTGWYVNDCHGVWEKGRQACDTLDAVALQLLKGT